MVGQGTGSTAGLNLNRMSHRTIGQASRLSGGVLEIVGGFGSLFDNLQTSIDPIVSNPR